MQSKKLIVTRDGSHTFLLPELNETYHSTHGAIQESEYVFIEKGLDYAARQKQEVRIFEVGLGTGLNALLSWNYADQLKVVVRYTSIEAFPLSAKETSAINYPDRLQGIENRSKFQQIHACQWGECHQLADVFSFKKVNEKMQEYESEEHFDLCYFDAFAPSRQPEMWDMPVLEKVRDMLMPQGIFVTYCARGQLKRDLKVLGFEVETLPGPPGKKEMVRGILPR